MQLSKSYKIFLITVMLLSVGKVRADYPVGKKRTALTGTFNYFYSNKYFINDLVYMSDYYLKVENLSTGYLKEINGQV